MKLMLRQERIDRGWTQEHVAEQIGITKTAVQYLETAKCKPSYDVLVKLEDLFHLNHRQLFAVADDNTNLTTKEYHEGRNSVNPKEESK